MAMDPRESQYSSPTNKSCPKITSSRQWSTYKNNPRIVRASRALGGKDRHSKVFTLRGLRDRRIRLSETTAIKVYDLQHRLGFGQPSKVVDWLIDAVKEEIDKLPPLPIVPRFHQPNEPSYLSSHQEDNSTAMTNVQDYCQGLVGFEPQNYFTCQSLVSRNLQLWDHSRNLSSSQFGRGISLSRQVEVDHHRGLAMASSHDNVVSRDTMMPSSFPSCNIINQTPMDSNDPSRHLSTSLMMRTFGFDANITDRRQVIYRKT